MFNNLELKNQHRKILNLINVVKELEADDEIRSHLSKYLCVLCSGFLENSIYHIFSDISENLCENSYVLSYTKKQLYKVQNTNTKKIEEITRAFNPQWWEEKVLPFIEDENRKEAINFILKERHNIAHGRNSDITIDKLELYFSKSVLVMKYIEDNLLSEN